MIAHLDVRRRRVARLIHIGQYMYIGTRTLVINIPLVIGHNERGRNTLHYRMLLIFYNQRTVGQRSYVILETHATHKIREPLPHGITVKLAQQSGMMETNPAAMPFFYILDERIFRFLRPSIRREIQLNNQAELRQVSLRYVPGIVYLGNTEIPFCTFGRQPPQTGIRKSSVLSATFRQHQYLRLVRLAQQVFCYCTAQITLLIVSAIIPIHASQQIFIQNILTLDGK